MVTFHTNLDLAKPYVQRMHASGLEALPHKGDRIRFGDAHSFELEVVQRTFHANSGNVAIELHIPSYDSRSIKEWEAWFKSHMFPGTYTLDGGL